VRIPLESQALQTFGDELFCGVGLVAYKKGMIGDNSAKNGLLKIQPLLRDATERHDGFK